MLGGRVVTAAAAAAVGVADCRSGILEVTTCVHGRDTVES